MGLDQHAHAKNHQVNWELFYSNDKEETKKVFVWRKHARLQKFMDTMWKKQNPNTKASNGFNLGFNADDNPVIMTQEVVEKLEEAIKENYHDYFAHDGFFWGQQFQEESVKQYKDQDLKFLEYCKEALKSGEEVIYECSW